ncbi:MAG: hypothetical protein AB9883_00975 [Acidaminococcaceae bacterium]
MDIRYKLYPYPVLSYYSDDYVDSGFDVAVEVKKDGYNIRINFLTELKNSELTKYLKEGKIKFVYHLECAQTGFRKALQTSNYDFTHIISNKEVSGKLQICPYIVAMEDIRDYVNASFNEDYRGFKFLIEAGCVMAVGRQVNADINKDINDLANTPSVFSIVKNADETATDMIVDMYQKKIVIKLPEKDFYNYKSLKNEASIQPILNSLVIIPVLTYVLNEIARQTIDERETNYSMYNWYRAINKAMSLRLHCRLDDEEFQQKNMLEVAQKLINDPLSEALQAMAGVFAIVPEEDEE